MEHVNALPAGTRLGEYEVVDVLGAGGFGLTYRAWDTALEKYVAIKEYLPRDFATRTNTRTVVPTSQADRADYEWGLTRFLDEARTLARFDHPHINKVHRFFEAHGTAYLVLEYIEGETLGALLGRQGRLDEAQVEGLLTDVLSGLTEVHEAGYVHRDIKPGNLMVKPDGNVVVLDFGAARQAVGQRSKSVTSILTPGYAPLEQYDTKAEDVGPWSDIYALGMVAYRCISGLSDGELPDAVTRSRSARKGSGDLEPAASIGQGRYDARLLRAIDWAIQVEEDARPQSIAEWQQALPGLTPSESRARPEPPKPDPPASSSRWALVVGVVALMVAVAGGAYWYAGQQGLLSGGPLEVASGPAVTEPDRVESRPGGETEETEIETEIETEGEELVGAGGPSAEEVEAGLGLDREARRLVQQGLMEAGQEPGPADGLFGGDTTRTRQAIRAWQAAKDMEASGFLTQEQADALIELGRARTAQQRLQAEETRQRAEAERFGRLLQMVRVPGGTFTMGCTREQSDCDDDEKPAHQVQVRDFEIGKYEVTQELWEAVMGTNPSNFSGCAQCPVEQVSWDDIQEFLRKLNAGGGRYRLPSEAEWEYAARGGVQSRGYQYAGGNSPGAVAWYEDNSGSRTHRVGQKQANELGLHDLSGNVWEWVQDCWNGSYQGAPSDGGGMGAGGVWSSCPARRLLGRRSEGPPLGQPQQLGPLRQSAQRRRIPSCPVAPLGLESLPLYFRGPGALPLVEFFGGGLVGCRLLGGCLRGGCGRGGRGLRLFGFGFGCPAGPNFNGAVKRTLIVLDLFPNMQRAGTEKNGSFFNITFVFREPHFQPVPDPSGPRLGQAVI